MNKIALLLTLTVTAVAITITTSVTTNTEANVTTPFSATVADQDIKGVLNLTNTVSKNAASKDAEIQINDGTQVLSTISTTTTVADLEAGDTTIDSATASANANFEEGSEI